MAHDVNPVTGIFGEWPEGLGSKPDAESIEQCKSKGFEGLELLQAVMMLRPMGASQGELDEASRAYGFDGWHGCSCRKAEPAVNTQCPVHGIDYEGGPRPAIGKQWQCLIIGPDGCGYYALLAAESASHAFEKASSEFDGVCVAVRRPG